MRLRDLVPRTGSRKARKAWDELFSRDVLGAVVIGTASGKFVEHVVGLAVLYLVGAQASPYLQRGAFIAAWTVSIVVGIYLFIYWHDVAKQADDAADELAETVDDVSDEVNT